MKILRSYQLAAINKIVGFLKSPARACEAGLVVMPPGSGKTFTTTSALQQWIFTQNDSTPVIWFAHNYNLLLQAKQAFRELNFSVLLHSGPEKSLEVGTSVGIAIVASVQSIDSLQDSIKRFLQLPNTNSIHNAVIVIDECHHLPCNTFQVAANYGPTAIAAIWPESPIVNTIKRIGLTATPFRLDEKPLDFNRVIYKTETKTLIRQKFLATPIYYQVKTYVQAKLKLSGKDFSVKSLTKLHTNERAKVIAKAYRAEKHGRTLVFLPSVAACKLQKQAFAEIHPTINTAVLTGKTPAAHRQKIIADYEAGKIQVICNVMVMSEGVDLPTTQTLFLARPTLSKALYVQQIGRGTRLAAGKTTFNIVDFVDQIPKYATFTGIWREEVLGIPLDENTKVKIKVQQAKNTLKTLKLTPAKLRLLTNTEELLSLYAIWLNTKASYAITGDNLRPLLATRWLASQLNRSTPYYYSLIKYITYPLIGYQVTTSKNWQNLFWELFRGIKPHSEDSMIPSRGGGFNELILKPFPQVNSKELLAQRFQVLKEFDQNQQLQEEIKNYLLTSWITRLFYTPIKPTEFTIFYNIVDINKNPKINPYAAQNIISTILTQEFNRPIQATFFSGLDHTSVIKAAEVVEALLK